MRKSGKVLDEISYPSPNLNCCTVEVLKWTNNFIVNSHDVYTNKQMKIPEKLLDYDTKKLSHHIDYVSVITYPRSKLTTCLI